MPKVAYSEEDRERIRTELVTAGLELMAKQGIQRTTVEQIYKSRDFPHFLLFIFRHERRFDCRDPVPAAAQAHRLCGKAHGQSCPELAGRCKAVSPHLLLWREKRDCHPDHRGTAAHFQAPVRGKLSGIPPKAAPSLRRNLRDFRNRGRPGKGRLIYEPEPGRDSGVQGDSPYAPLFVPEAADETVDFQLNAIVDALEKLRAAPMS